MTDPDPSTWTTVVLRVGPDAEELAVDGLLQAGAAGVEVLDDGDGLVLRGGFEARAEAELAAAAADRAGHGPAALEAVVDDGLDAWRDHAEPVPAGPWWLVPAWVADPPEADPGRVVRLEPGRTFGSGSHPTTQLVVAQLDHLVRPGHRVLDVGCGSGVLAVVAARLGATTVVGIDIDPAAPATTLANAEANGVGGVVVASDATVADAVAAHGPFDVVAANVLAPVIAELAADLVAAVAPGGVLVVSGLLADRWPTTTDRLAPLVVREVDDDGTWASVVLGTAADHALDSPPGSSRTTGRAGRSPRS